MDKHQGLMSLNWSTQIMQTDEFRQQGIVWRGYTDFPKNTD